MTARKAPRWVVAAGLLFAALAALFAVRENGQPARDRRALLRHAAEMERMIRAHDARIWLHVETDAHARDAEHDAIHRAMLLDFERLSHLDGFEMRDGQIEVSGDAARVRYSIRGEPQGRGERVPSRGEIRFVRGPAGWVMTGHRFLDDR